MFTFFNRTKLHSEERLRPVTTNNRRELLSMATQGASRTEKMILARQAIYALDPSDLQTFVQEMDREMWRRVKV